MNKGIYSDSAIRPQDKVCIFIGADVTTKIAWENHPNTRAMSFFLNSLYCLFFEEEKWMENKTCWKRRNIRPLPTLNCENRPKKRLCKVIFATLWASLRRHSLNFRIKMNQARWVILRESCVFRHAHFCQIVFWFLLRNATDFEEKVWKTKKSLQPTSKK